MTKRGAAEYEVHEHRPPFTRSHLDGGGVVEPVGDDEAGDGGEGQVGQHQRVGGQRAQGGHPGAQEVPHGAQEGTAQQGRRREQSLLVREGPGRWRRMAWVQGLSGVAPSTA